MTRSRAEKRARRTAGPDAGATARIAIAKSIIENRITYLDPADLGCSHTALEDVLIGLADGWCEAGTQCQFWGRDSSDEWRVHVVRERKFRGRRTPP